jgi:hypothetical protein
MVLLLAVRYRILSIQGMNNADIRRTERLVVLVPPALMALLDAEARREFMTRSEWIRQTLLARVRTDAGDGRPVS